MPLNEELNHIVSGQFMIPLEQAPCKAPVPFCFGCFCPCCAAYTQREKLLELTGEEYICCGGACAMGPLGEPQPKMPCLLLESCCCTWMAISANRYMVQTRFGRRNGPCDDFIIMFTVCFANAISILSCFFDIPQELAMLSDMLVCTVQGCMHAQNEHEIKKIQEEGYQKPSQQVILALPPVQQQMIKKCSPPLNEPVVQGRPVQQQMYG